MLAHPTAMPCFPCPDCCRCKTNPVVRFRIIIAVWVLVATGAVSTLVWLFIKNATSSAVDMLAWRMTGVVRVLSKEQVRYEVAVAWGWGSGQHVTRGRPRHCVWRV